MRRCFGVIMAVLAVPLATVHASDGSVLFATRDPMTPGAIRLDWIGPGPQFEVYRSIDLATLLDPANRITTSFTLTYIDPSPPAAPLVYYALDSVCITPSPDKPDDAFVDADCDGIDGTEIEAIFVASDVGDDANPGTRSRPMRTLGTAIAAAQVQGKDVYVSRGVYAEDVVLVSNVGVYGGYDAARSWARSASSLALVSGGRHAVRADAVADATFDRFTVLADSAQIAGESSYGVWAVGSTGLTLANLWIEPGNGAGGDDGLPGLAGAGGGDGGAGQPGCESSSGLCSTCSRPAGGANGASGCGREGGGGGQPGNGTGEGDPGAGGVGGTGGGAPGSGNGARCGSSGDGGRGGDGVPGGTGAPGGGGADLGLGDASGYVPSHGADGTVGAGGNGGGGGGGGGGGVDVCDSYGSSGGGGGAGGCPGQPGGAGMGGGGSFGIYLFDTSVAIRRTTVARGLGGDGGVGMGGGPGGRGGTGGPGGPYGGTNEQDDASCGGGGGDGGVGGDGGSGGGGGGGPSIGLYVGGSSVADTTGGFTAIAGSGGRGGLSPVNPGADGIVAEIVP